MRAASWVAALAASLALSLGAGVGADTGWTAESSSGIDAGAVNEAPALKAFNWEKLTQEATALLSQYIRIDTTNPPGNELGAARMLRDTELTGESLFAAVREFAEADGVLEKMGSAARQFARPGAAARAAEILEEVSRNFN